MKNRKSNEDQLRERPEAAGPEEPVTANAFEEDRQVALQAGMSGHPTKPYDIPVILETLKGILR